MAPTSDKNSHEGKLREDRGYVRQRITKLHKKIEDELVSLTNEKKGTYVSRLKDLKGELNNFNKAIYTYLKNNGTSEDDLNVLLDDDDEYDELIDSLIDTLRGINGSDNLINNNMISMPIAANTQPNMANTLASNKLKLPKVPLPEYSNGKDECLRKFLRSFENIMAKHNLNSYDKFIYLKNQLSSGPRTLIDSLDVDQQSYETAKELLEKAFGSTINAKNDLVRKLSNLHLSNDPYSYIGEVRTILAGVESLDITVNDILQFFIWQGLNFKFQEHLVHITNKNNPSLTEITDHYFEATDRYLKNNSIQSTKRDKLVKYDAPKPSGGLEHSTPFSTSTMAINVKTSKNKEPYCSLCKSDGRRTDHSIRTCQVFDTSSKKVNKLKSINGCIRCSFVNHSTNNCRFKFDSKCMHCKGEHMTFLCLKNGMKNNQVNTICTESSEHNINEPQNINCRTSVVEITNVQGNDAVLLPTFTAHIKDLKGNLQKVRVFKDSGCQRVFIREHLQKKLGLEVLDDNLPLNIHGFLSSKNVLSKLVRFGLIIAGKTVDIEAICIEKITTKFNTGNIEQIVDSFKTKGYEFADIDLEKNTGIVKDIDIVLGTEYEHLLPTNDIVFGEGELQDCSYFKMSKIGVLLSGSVSKLIPNLEALPPQQPPITACNFIAEGFNSAIKGIVNDNQVSQINEKIDCDTIIMSNDVKITEINNSGILDDNICTNDITDANIVDTELSCDKLNEICNDTLNIAAENNDDRGSSITNIKLADYVLKNTERSSDGRLVVPITWNSKNAHRLSKNFHLSKSILKSMYNKLLDEPTKLQMYNEVFKEQEQMGIIERIENIDSFCDENPSASFLPHMGIFKMSRETTKCRVVFLSNLCEKSKHPEVVSHNQSILPGPPLNHKIATSIMLLRFDKYMMTYDLAKAFLTIALKEIDQNRLMFLWYKNIERGDFSLIAYRNKRLPFGLTASPFLLMVSLYKMLILDDAGHEKIKQVKREAYNTLYMDNGSLSSNDESDLEDSYDIIKQVFHGYKFGLQQLCTNSASLQEKLDAENVETEPTPDSVKLLGMTWNRVTDTLSPNKIQLDETADTKRKILGTLNGIYDVYNIYGPMVLRAKIFMQRLQCDQNISWDTALSQTLLNEWKNIAKQANGTPIVEIPRFVGERNATYSLIGITDASSSAYGTVIYIKDLNTQRVSFLMAKNRLLNETLKGKTMPSLELQGICFGVETLQEVRESLSGQSVVVPIKISEMHLYTDSTACLHWLHKYAIDFSKMQKLSVFNTNRLRNIDELCRKFPITFRHIEGNLNTADYLTKPCSYKILSKTYYTGPEFLVSNSVDEHCDLVVKIPNPVTMVTDEVPECASARYPSCSTDVGRSDGNETVSEGPQNDTHAFQCIDSDVSRIEHFIPVNKYSNFNKLVCVHRNVLRFINNIKLRLNRRHQNDNYKCYDDSNLHNLSMYNIIKVEQQSKFPEIFDYFRSNKKHLKDLPDLLTQLNLFLDENDVLRVRAKFRERNKMPIFLPKNSVLTSLIIRNAHEKLGHTGIYSVLKELRNSFWIPKYFSTIKRVLNKCIVCKKMNAPTIKLNQNAYKEFRVSPSTKPFSSVFIDYIGPIEIKLNGVKSKVYLLIFSCLWSRSTNLKICRTADVKDFLRAVQLHVYEYGIFNFCISDQGSQIRAGANIISTFLNEYETKTFFESYGIKEVVFQNYPKGNSALGSVVESYVKIVKHLLFKSIKSHVLDYFDFEMIVQNAIHLINKRPIAFKEGMRSLKIDECPEPITPEIILKGYETCSINVIPYLQSNGDEEDPDYGEDPIRKKYSVLRKVRENLYETYHNEFLATLMVQATDKKGRYVPTPHRALVIGDIVLLTEKNTKRYDYEMGRVVNIETNSLGEVTAARIRKGKSREVVYRHVTSLILVIPHETTGSSPVIEEKSEGKLSSTSQRLGIDDANSVTRKLPARKAAIKCREKIAAGSRN